MKFYDEEKMAEVRGALELEIMQWPGVSSKPMMGCLCYFYGRRFFALLVTGGIVLQKDRAKLTGSVRGEPFKMSERASKSWIKLPLKKPENVKLLLPFIRNSYESVSADK